MARYNEVSQRVWISSDFKKLSSDGKLLWLFFLTGPMKTPLPGIYHMGVGSCLDHIRWDRVRFLKSFEELQENGMVEADWDNNVILLPKWARYNRPPANDKVLKGWLNILDNIPDCNLKMRFIESLGEMCERYTEDKGSGNWFESGMAEWEDKISSYDDAKPKRLVADTKKKEKPKPKEDSKLVGVEVGEQYYEMSLMYHTAVKSNLPTLSHLLNGQFEKTVFEGAIELEKLVRINNYTDEQIQSALKWAVDSYDEGASFNWLEVLQSLKGIRRKSKNGLMKFENLLSRVKQVSKRRGFTESSFEGDVE